MKKKRKTKIIVLVIIIIIVIFLIIGNRLYSKKQDEKFADALKYYQCTYYTTTNSKENEFEKDVYMKIPYKPVDNQGDSNQYYYEQIIKTIATLLEKNNYRIIDEENEVIIRVRFENGNAKYTINGDNNYYENKKVSMITKNTNKPIKLNAKANELLKIEENNWGRAEVREVLGNSEKNEDEYDIYGKLGIKFKSINLEIFNVIFTKDYKDEVFEGIKTGLDNSEVRKLLGKPTFENSDGNMLVGYLTDNYYVFFSNGEISIYRIAKFDKEKNEKFAKILSELLTNKNSKDFLDKLTDIYPDFSEYIRNENGVEIKYPHLGFDVKFVNNGKSGITIYKNYNGKITEDTSILDVNNGKSLPSNIYFENKDGIFENELHRLVKSVQKNNSKR